MLSTLIDTHCHINMIVKSTFDVAMSSEQCDAAKLIVDQAHAAGVTTIINVGTSLVESQNCVMLAHAYPSIYAAVGIHPNDCTATWRADLHEIEKLLMNDAHQRIVAIGECGLDRHYPDYDLPRQKDAFKAQIEMALEYDRALIVHTRDAADETLRSLEEFKGQVQRGVIHCFSEDQSFANQVIEWGYALGIGGTLTYPKNNALRAIATRVPLTSIILETDAPFLPPQVMRGKQNNPASIRTIAEYLAELRGISVEEVGMITSERARRIFLRE